MTEKKYKITLLSLLIFGLNIAKISMISVFLPFISRKKIGKEPWFFIIGLWILILFVLTYYSTIYYDELIKFSRAIEESLLILGAYILGGAYIKSSKLANILIASITGFCLFAFASTLYTLLNPTLINIQGRIIINFWNHEATINGPLLGVYITPVLSVFPFVFFPELSKRIRIFLFVLFSIGMFTNILLDNRSPFVIALVLWIMIFLLSIKLQSKLIILVILSIIIILFMHYYDEIPFLKLVVDRFKVEGLNTPRYTLWKLGIQNLFLNFFGGGKGFKSIYSAYHNAWLDIGDYGGGIPVLTLLSFQTFHLIILLKILNKGSRKIKKENQLLLILILSYYMASMGEPILVGSVWFFALGMFFNGVVISRYQFLKSLKFKFRGNYEYKNINYYNKS